MDTESIIPSANGVEMSVRADDLSMTDPEMYNIIHGEHERQGCSLELIASGNFTSRAVLQATGSCMINKISEGQVGHR